MRLLFGCGAGKHAFGGHSSASSCCGKMRQKLTQRQRMTIGQNKEPRRCQCANFSGQSTSFPRLVTWIKGSPRLNLKVWDDSQNLFDDADAEARWTMQARVSIRPRFRQRSLAAPSFKDGFIAGIAFYLSMFVNVISRIDNGSMTESIPDSCQSCRSNESKP